MAPEFLLMYACVLVFLYFIFTGTIEVRYKGYLLNGVEMGDMAP